MMMLRSEARHHLQMAADTTLPTELRHAHAVAAVAFQRVYAGEPLQSWRMSGVDRLRVTRTRETSIEQALGAVAALT